MARILIAYGTTDGYTRKIVTHLAARIRSLGHEALAFDTVAVPRRFEPARIDAFILGGSVYFGKHQKNLVQWARESTSMLRHAPTAFFSVSLTARSDHPDAVAATEQAIEMFVRQSGWTPDVIVPVAGAILYQQYGFFRRMLMKHLSRKYGNPTDTSRDYEFTDWDALDAFVDSFLADYVEAPSEDVAEELVR